MNRPGHRPGKKGHRVLERLALGPATFRELLAAAEIQPKTAESRRFWRLLDAMAADGLIELTGFYRLTDKGVAALAHLDAGHVVPISDPARSAA